MKQLFKNVLKKSAFYKSMDRKFNTLNCEISELEFQNQILANSNIDLRLRLKRINGEKINVVFVCHRPAVWESLHSVYDAMMDDDSFNVKIVAIPNKKEIPGKGLNHEIYESEGAEEFWKDYGCINGYDYETGEWLDLKTLEPDYIFFQQPYNVTRCPEYKSWVVSKYAKICYVAYAFDFIGHGVLEETTPTDYMKNVSFYFTQNAIDDELIRNVLKNQNNYYTKTFMSGFPRYDGLDAYIGCESELWKQRKEKKAYRILWTPRWCTNEGNCSFFDYKDKLVEFIDGNTTFDFIFRPHPQAFLNWNRTGELSESEAQKYCEQYEASPNMCVDRSSSYFKTIFSSDCLISDTSSVMADYFLTGKPIIYCHKVNTFNEVSSMMAEGFYWANNWGELRKILDDLSNGVDPLKTKREEIKKELKLDLNTESAGKLIMEYVRQDAMKK